MPWAVSFHDALAAEFADLPEPVQEELLAHARLLAEFGPSLGRPRVDTLKGSRIANLKELRFAAGGGVRRVAFAFDAHRIAVLLAAGDKTWQGRGPILPDTDRDGGAALHHVDQSRRRRVRMTDANLGEGHNAIGTVSRISAHRGARGIGGKLDEMLERLPAERRARVEARANELIAEEMSIRDLRKALGKTQVAVAKKLGLKQENVSRIEQRADVLLSTLDGYLKALGGRLRLVAEFKNRPSVTLAGFAALKGTGPCKTGHAAKSGRSRAVR